MSKKSLIFRYRFILLTISQSDIYIGTAGSISYYQNEVNKNEPSNNVGPDGSRIYVYPMGRDSARYSSLVKIVTGKSRAENNGYTCTKLFYDSIPSGRKNYSYGALVEMDKKAVAVIETNGCDISGTGGVHKIAYKIDWIESPYTLTPLISAIAVFGADVILDVDGRITGGSSLPLTTFEYSSLQPSFAGAQSWACADKFNVRLSGYIDKDC